MSIFHKEKFFDMYKEIAAVSAKQSYCERRKVGACIVTVSGVISIGFNGVESGKPNVCELPDGTTRPDVIHAEINAINKLEVLGVDIENAVIFVTTAPCINCAMRLHLEGITSVYYRDVQSNTEGLDYLESAGVYTERYGIGTKKKTYDKYLTL